MRGSAKGDPPRYGLGDQGTYASYGPPPDQDLTSIRRREFDDRLRDLSGHVDDEQRLLEVQGALDIGSTFGDTINRAPQ